MGVMQNRNGDRSGALASFRTALAISQTLADANPEVTEFQQGLADIHDNIAVVQASTGDITGALVLSRRAVAIRQKLVDAKPTVDEFRYELAANLSALGDLQRSVGLSADAVASLRRAISVLVTIPANAGSLYNLARCRSLLARAAAGASSGLTSDQARAESDQAMTTLRRALAAGYRDLARLRTDPDLDSLRGRVDFRSLLLDLSFPANPFAPRTGADHPAH
jgi:tetratricopeptide (TPR) repeat protein